MAAAPGAAESTASAEPSDVAAAAECATAAAVAVAPCCCRARTTRHYGTWVYMACSRSTVDAGQWPSEDYPRWWVAKCLQPASPAAIVASAAGAVAAECRHFLRQTEWKARV